MTPSVVCGLNTPQWVWYPVGIDVRSEGESLSISLSPDCKPRFGEPHVDVGRHFGTSLETSVLLLRV